MSWIEIAGLVVATCAVLVSIHFGRKQIRQGDRPARKRWEIQHRKGDTYTFTNVSDVVFKNVTVTPPNRGSLEIIGGAKIIAELEPGSSFTVFAKFLPMITINDDVTIAWTEELKPGSPTERAAVRTLPVP